MLRWAIRSFSKVQPNPKTSNWFSSKLKCTSLTEFYGSNYYCTECEKGFKMANALCHRCLLPNTLPSLQARFDSSIRSMSSMSVIFQQQMLSTPYCAHLRQSGYGSKQCLQNQEVMSQLQQNQQWQKLNQITPMWLCPLSFLQCLPQNRQGQMLNSPITEQDNQPSQKRKRGAHAGLATLPANHPTLEWTDNIQPLPIFVYFDIQGNLLPPRYSCKHV